MPFDAFVIPAPAKVNLFLHVTGKRDDGYHLLQSLVAFADAGDSLSFLPAAEFHLSLSGPFATELTADEGNLVSRAARAMEQEYGRPLSCHIELQKNLPVAAGIGGGSADAAAALRGIGHLWGISRQDARVVKIAAGLGADVPACLLSKPALAEGVGEILTPVPHMPKLHAVLVNPGVPCPTPEVFSRFALQKAATPVSLPRDGWIDFLKSCRNDLTAAAQDVCPEITLVLKALSETKNCDLARLSGSGATCFGLYNSAAEAKAAAQDLSARHPGWWVVPVVLS